MTGKEQEIWVGFDLGGTKMLSIVYDSTLTLLGRKRRRTKGHDGVQAGLIRVGDTIEMSLQAAGVKPSALTGIGVGCPGPLDLDAGVILEAPNLGWVDAPVREMLEDRFNCPAIIANDVDAGVYGEYRFGAARDARCAIGIFPGTGIGGGCVYEGRILRGRTSSCLEVGFMHFMPDGPRAGSGPRGTLEAIASRLAISAQAAQAVYRGQAPNLKRAAGTDLSLIRSGALAKSIAEGDSEIERIVREAAGYVGQAVGTLVNLLAPDVVVLGGGLVEAMPELYLAAVEQRARQSTLPSFSDTFRIVAAKLGDDAAARGAAAWVQQNVKELAAVH